MDLSDILKDLQDEMDRLASDPERNLEGLNTYILLNRAYGEITRLRKTKVETSGPDAGSGIWMRKE